MPVLQVFDPPMCCSTGVCGPSVDPELARFSGDLEGVVVRKLAIGASCCGPSTSSAGTKKSGCC